MKLPQVMELFDYWQKHPPAHLLLAIVAKFERPKTTEEKWAEGALNPREAVAHYRARGGK
jgi:hypothetical protein